MKKKKLIKRMSAILLAGMLMASMAPAGALAAEMQGTDEAETESEAESETDASVGNGAENDGSGEGPAQVMKPVPVNRAVERRAEPVLNRGQVQVMKTAAAEMVPVSRAAQDRHSRWYSQTHRPVLRFREILRHCPPWECSM